MVKLVAVRKSVVPSSLLTGLVSYWKLDETTGDRIDAVGANDLTPNGTSVTYGAGKIGNAVDCTRANTDYLSRAAANLSGMPTGGAQGMTVSYWVYLRTSTTENNYQQLVAYRVGAWQGTYQGFICLVRWSTLANATLVYNGPVNTTNAVCHGPDLTLNNWHFCTYQYDAENQRVRHRNDNSDLNGWVSLVGGIGTMGDPTGADLYLGQNDGLSVDRGLDGLLDEVGIWTRCLSDAELVELYDAGSGKTHPFT